MPNPISYYALHGYAERVNQEDRAALPFANFEYFVPTQSNPRLLSYLYEQFYDNRAHGLRPHHVAEANDYLESKLSRDESPILVSIPRKGHDFPTDTCSYSEEAFCLARRQFYEPIRDYEVHRIISVYHDASERPILLRKNNDVSNALALVALRLTGSNIAVPAGSIVSVGNLKPKDITGTAYIDQDSMITPRTTLHSIILDPLKHPVLPLRLSAWAFPRTLDRAIYAIDNDNHLTDTERFEIVTKTTIEDYRVLSRQLLNLCMRGPTQIVNVPVFGNRSSNANTKCTLA